MLAAAALLICVDYPWGDLQDHAHWTNVRWIPFVSPPLRAVDITANLLLGVPLGVAAVRAIGLGRATTGILVLSVSLAGESLQLFSHTRFPSVTDVVCNVAGAVVAAHIALRRRTSPSSPPEP